MTPGSGPRRAAWFSTRRWRAPLPEGDTIALTATALERWLAGSAVRSARPPRFGRLAGQRVDGVQAVGKHLFLSFSSGLALHSHLGMGGSWHLYRPGERWRAPERAASIVLEFDDAVAVCFRAQVAELVRDRSTVAHLGPDVLAASFDPADAVRRARALGLPTVGEALLDQRAAAGIGNVYRCEVLWMHRISPFRPLAECDDALLRSLFASAAEAMTHNAGRSAAREFPHGRVAVHGRAGRPCPRCGTPVRSRRLGEHARLAYWCPRCQAS